MILMRDMKRTKEDNIEKQGRSDKKKMTKPILDHRYSLRLVDYDDLKKCQIIT
jgi:hypothetical protein